MEKQPPKNQSARTCNSDNPPEPSIENTENAAPAAHHVDTSRTESSGTSGSLRLLDLKLPVLPDVNPDAIRYEQAYAGVTVHIPGSPHIRRDDMILFHWGQHVMEAPSQPEPADSDVARVVCITYHYLPHAQYGIVDLFYEVQREGVIIGESPILHVNVHFCAPVTPKQRHRKRAVSRRYPSN